MINTNDIVYLMVRVSLMVLWVHLGLCHQADHFLRLDLQGLLVLLVRMVQPTLVGPLDPFRLLVHEDLNTNITICTACFIHMCVTDSSWGAVV